MLFFRILAPLIFILQVQIKAQTFYNGSFETTSATACTQTLSNVQCNARMPNVFAFGNYDNGIDAFGMKNPVGRLSLHDSTCFLVTPQHGNWCLGLRSAFNPSYDAIALELTTALDSGALYYLSFYVFGNLSFRNFMLNVDIGESMFSNSFGKMLYSAQPDLLAWKNIRFSFTASQASKFITLKTRAGYGSWHQVDNFVISRSQIQVSLDENSSVNAIRIYPNPASDVVILNCANEFAIKDVELSNSLGERVLQKSGLSASETQIDIRDLPPGIYSIRAKNSNMSLVRKLLIAR